MGGARKDKGRGIIGGMVGEKRGVKRWGRREIERWRRRESREKRNGRGGKETEGTKSGGRWERKIEEGEGAGVKEVNGEGMGEYKEGGVALKLCILECSGIGR